MLGLETDNVEQFGDATGDLHLRHRGVDAERLGDQVAHPAARIERGIGVLEHHLDASPHRAHLASRKRGDVRAGKAQRARSQIVKPGDATAQR